ncbi:MAG: HAD family hydrolase [Gemmatimonadetes bacterium]|nr:MAG: HAD family hydrolase [Gemmatimonadota bacterium]
MSLRTLVLFDVDGTLVTGGPARHAFHTAMLETFGTAGPIDSHDFSGKTDPQIARELLEAAGFDAARIDRGLPALWAAYLTELERRLAAQPMRALPGAEALLDALDALDEVALALLTGNVARGAELKLGSAGLGGRFRVGAFGSDREERDALPEVALERAREHWDADFDPARVFVVGDTPLDVRCGRVHGLRTVAVATGNHTKDALAGAGADVTFDDLSDTEAVLEVLAE